MSRQNLPVILLSLLVAMLLLAYFLKENLNNLISEKLQESARSEYVLSGKHWVDSLFNYTNNKKDFEFTLLQFKSTGCNICKQMEPELEMVKRIPGLKVNVAVLNVMNPNSLNVMNYFGISAVPTHLILDKNGNEKFRKYGFISAEKLVQNFH